MFPLFWWRRQDSQKQIFLTFDDGPIPEVTPNVLDILQRYGAQATFFCVGHNIDKHPDIFRNIVDQGHSVGNHTYHHLDGWRHSVKEYIEDVQRCQQTMLRHGQNGQMPLMRPPYGRMKPAQWRALGPNYQIVMWEVLSGDYHPGISAETCLARSVNSTSDGSIVLFHDSLKTQGKLERVLPKFLDHFAGLGYSFQRL